MSRNRYSQSLLDRISSELRNIRKHKDNLFCLLFNEEKEGLLELYNALNGSSYTNINELQIVTIKSALYITYKNDVAYLLGGTINLYEHQSTYNPNMPVRFLIYLATEYQKIIDERDSNIYSSRIMPLPTPKCVVFYNGKEKDDDSYEMRLSDAFENKDTAADAELTVHIYNINNGHNQSLMDKCPTLDGYVHLIDKINRYKRNMNVRRAVELSIEECIDEGYLEKFLRRHRSEVLGMLLFDTERKKYERAIREDAREYGLAEGRAEGRAEGQRLAITKLADHYMSEKPGLSKEDAIALAESILK